MNRVKYLFNDFSEKLNKAMKTSSWDDLTACWAARERLEAYLDQPRDGKGRFLKHVASAPTSLSKSKEK